MSDRKLQVVPLGGLGEFGMNIMALRYGDDIIVIDCGMMFPEAELLGVDIVTPDLTYLVENREHVRALFLTHGHEDHIGAVPYFLAEFDVDALSDGKTTWIGGIQEHIEKAGIHSGDSFSVLPAWKVTAEKLREMAEATRRLAAALSVKGLMNVQFAVQKGVLYVLEVNPRASRTVPFVSKAIGVPMARFAALLAAGRSLESLGLPPERQPVDFFIKAPVFPFRKFPGEDVLLGPEMKSTGEVMGISPRFGDAFAKACEAIGTHLPLEGMAFLTVNPYDKGTLIPIARELADLGFRLCATEGTREALAQSGLEAEHVFKVNEGSPNAVDRMEAGEIHLVVNTPLGGESHYDEAAIRAAALRLQIPCLTTLSAAAAAVEGIRAWQEEATGVAALQEYHRT